MRPRSKVCARLACESCEVIFASSTNILMKSSSSATAGRIRLMATIFSKPSTPTVLALKTSAMPPTLMRSRRKYFPKGTSLSKLLLARAIAQTAKSSTERQTTELFGWGPTAGAPRPARAIGSMLPGRDLLGDDGAADLHGGLHHPREERLLGGRR